MGPTKAIVREGAIIDAKTGKVIKDGLTTHQELEDYASHHYIALPVVDKSYKAWQLGGKPVFCLRGSQFETLDEQPVHLARCPDCGGMGIRTDEPMVESDCLRCIQCRHEFDARLEMMER